MLFSAGAAAIVFVLMIIYAFISGLSKKSSGEIFKRLAIAFNYTVVLAIASFPEGLPLTIVLALAFSIGEMYKKDKVLVRDNSAPEIMGKVQEVLVGKSGTITKGEMRVRKFRVNNKEIQNSRKDTVLNCELEESTIFRVKESVLFNTQARIEAGETTYGATGTPTDVATINFLQDADIPVHLFIQRRYDDKKIGEVNLRSDRRWAAVAVKDYDSDDIVRIYVKGAHEEILPMCGQHDNGDVLDGNNEDKLIRDLGKKGLRCISFAYIEAETSELENKIADCQENQA
jgi:magnesium-transporting ATPase (P-type)